VKAKEQKEFITKQVDVFKKRKIDEFVKDMNSKLRSELKKA